MYTEVDNPFVVHKGTKRKYIEYKYDDEESDISRVKIEYIEKYIENMYEHLTPTKTILYPYDISCLASGLASGLTSCSTPYVTPCTTPIPTKPYVQEVPKAPQKKKAILIL
jgi:hypothetical protein